MQPCIWADINHIKAFASDPFNKPDMVALFFIQLSIVDFDLTMKEISLIINRLRSNIVVHTITDQFIRYTLLVLVWIPFCLQKCLNSSWHRAWHASCYPWCICSIPSHPNGALLNWDLLTVGAFSIFSVKFKKPGADVSSFVTWHIILLEVARTWVT